MPQGTPGSGGGGDQTPGDGGGGSGTGTDPGTIDIQQIIDLLTGGNPNKPGGSSSSSGGGSSAPAPPIDPNIAQGARDYYSIWGVVPPTGYIEDLVLKQGMNSFEIIAHELEKPRAQTTPFYRDKFAYYANTAARIFGRR